MQIDLNISNLKVAGSVITTVMVILGGLWGIDSHYASAADVKSIQRQFASQIVQSRTEALEDELFKLDAKKEAGMKLTPVEEAMHNRYLRRLKESHQLKREIELQDIR